MRRRGGLFLLWMLLGTLACSLTVADEPTPVTQTELEESFNGPPPTVQIISPSPGQQTTIGSEVEIRVQANDAVGVTRLQLSVSGRVSSSKSFPEPATSAEAILTWQPDRAGTFELAVIAYRRTVPSQPVTITLEVVGRGQVVSNPITGQPQVVVAEAGTCTGRVLIGNLRRRAGPGTGFNNLGNFDLNEQVTVTGRDESGEWLFVRRLDGSENWVSNNPDWIATTGSCASLPVRNG